MAVDLHIHTTASDGTYSPAEIVNQAKKKEFTAIAITDHDTTDGIRSAQMEGNKVGLEVLAGVELSTDYYGTEIHILGYLFDTANKDFLSLLSRLKEARVSRIEKIVDKLQRLDINITLDRVKEFAGSGSIGRPHVARALLEKGYVSSNQQAFNSYIGQGCPAHVGRYKITPAEAIKMIRAAKGIPVLAHPGLIGRDQVIEELVGQGLMGIEAYHSDHNEKKTQAYIKLAHQHGLIVTGGSDCHGPSYKKETLLGKIRISYNHVIKLKQLRDKLLV